MVHIKNVSEKSTRRDRGGPDGARSGHAIVVSVNADVAAAEADDREGKPMHAWVASCI